MLIMAILTTIITLCTFFAVQIPPSKSDSYSQTILEVSECPAKTMFSGPKCEPRLEIVKLPLPVNFIGQVRHQLLQTMNVPKGGAV